MEVKKLKVCLVFQSIIDILYIDADDPVYSEHFKISSFVELPYQTTDQQQPAQDETAVDEPQHHFSKLKTSPRSPEIVYYTIPSAPGCCRKRICGGRFSSCKRECRRKLGLG